MPDRSVVHADKAFHPARQVGRTAIGHVLDMNLPAYQANDPVAMSSVTADDLVYAMGKVKDEYGPDATLNDPGMFADTCEHCAHDRPVADDFGSHVSDRLSERGFTFKRSLPS